MSSNVVNVTVGHRTQLECQIFANFGKNGSLDLQLRSQHPIPTSDLLAIGTSFGFTLPEGASLQNGNVGLQLKAKESFGSNSSLGIDGQATLTGTQVKSSALREPLSVEKALLSFTGDSVNVSELFAILAGSRLAGRMKLAQFKAPQLTFALQVDRLDLAKLGQTLVG